MKLGAADYFHKPGMNEQEIEEALAKIKDELEIGSQDAKETPGRAAQVHSREAMVRNLLHGNPDGIGQTKLREAGLYVMMFSIRQYALVVKRYTKNNASILPNTVMSIVSELLSKENEVEFAQIDDNLYSVVISHSETRSAQASFSHVNDIVYLISSSLKRFVNIDAVIGVSSSFQSFQEAKQAAWQARQALEQKFYHPNDPLFYYQHRTGNDEQTLEQANAYIVGMKKRPKGREIRGICYNLAEWEQYLRDTECMNEKDVKKIYEGLLFMLENGEDYLETRSRMEEIEDFGELSAFYHSVFNKSSRPGFTTKK